MDMTEKMLESREVYRGRILRVREDKVLLPNGKTGTREVVEQPGGVGILALTTAVLEIPAVAAMFGFTPISWGEYLLAMGLALLVVPIVEGVKAFQRARSRKRERR